MQVDDVVPVIGYIRTLRPILLQPQAGFAAAQRLHGFQLEAYVVVGILDNLHRQRATYGRVFDWRRECARGSGARDERRERVCVEIDRWDGGRDAGSFRHTPH